MTDINKLSGTMTITCYSLNYDTTMVTESYCGSMSTKTDLFSTPTTSNVTTKRCINLDWLEVHTREPTAKRLNADYFRDKGYIVHEREYGTRVYREMFTIEGTDGEPLLEIRRNPSSQGLNGIHDPNECHIRLVNRTCYFENAAAALAEFLKQHDYDEPRISRVDICLDFTHFDQGDDPQAFVRRYFRRRYSKINQGRINSHGEDTWTGQEWNSLSWGSKTSAVTTKLYNKTMELYEPKTGTYKKPYIRQAWQACGLIDDWFSCTKDGATVQVWRVEFSLRSAVKNWIPIEIDGEARNYQSLRNNLDCYTSRDKMLVLFASLAQHYFHFKYYLKNKRKDRCPDKILFDFKGVQLTYKIAGNQPILASKQRPHDVYNGLIAKIKAYQESHVATEIHKACQVLIDAMTNEVRTSELANPWSQEEIQYLRLVLMNKNAHPSLDVTVLMQEIKKLLAINDRTIIF